ncbi:hypothetical protein FOA43_004344 [Brettanomyces nanus]|uniref:Uncharacterized protein n=1 Tax=Eeniella nana TaxID=13502 RepID=A0A875RQH2_EENNA|nr:uncharacterized protein FOA43_004344 [Brettanomyces nanus]QPG76950.1 hypothetical protein FOA43_004344 [Brettanomyces nanus]
MELNSGDVPLPESDFASTYRYKNKLRLQGHKIKRMVANRKSRGFCDPFDRDLLIQRMDTFNILNWTINDSRLTPLECATNGWKCHSKRRNELHCQDCHATILVRLSGSGGIGNSLLTSRIGNQTGDSHMSLLSNFLFESDLEEEEEEAEFRRALVASYVSRLHSDHYQECVWRADNLDLSLVKRQYYLHNYDMDRIIPQFGTSLRLLGMHQQVILGRKNFKKDIISESDMGILKNYTKRKYNSSLLLLALLGWELRQQRFGNRTLLLLGCKNCTRRILLGEFPSNLALGGVKKLSSCNYPPSTVYNNEDGLHPKSSYEVIASGDKWIDEFGDDEVNLIKEHENWCCMVGRYSSSDLPGYKVVLQMLKSNTFIEDNDDQIMQEEDHTFDDSMAQLRSI